MTPGIRPLIAGNWKMNGARVSIEEFRVLGRGFDNGLDVRTDVLICPPATLLISAADILSATSVHIGGQDCAVKECGAHTGDISARMLTDAGARYVIVGHSERRIDHGETDAIVHAKTEAAWHAGLSAVVCIGESLSECEAGHTFDVLSRQIDNSVPAEAAPGNTVVAYEPVWAIGTGQTPTAQIVAETHAHIRNQLANKIGEQAATVRILYGGSVNPSNATELLGVENVDGALVGRAAMTGSDFLTLLRVLFG